MIAETGHFALVLALALALVQSVVPIWGARRGDRRMMAVAPSVAHAQFALVALAFAALTLAYVQSDFSVLNVYENSHSMKPLIYKITGVWGNHEGSMVLWILILALFGALVAAFGANLPASLKATVLSVQAWIATAFLLFVLLTSNPFVRILEPPAEGRGLNPILQDPGLAIHPPLLYGGYVGFSIAFSFAVAALIEGRIDAAWARWVRPWTLAAWIFLTLGIALGSYWAYYELGWGGWWFWDPVENASFMPWLSGTALLHSAIVMEKRNALKIWTVLLAILTFSLSLLGTFLVRSGVLTSVHSFATDPARGVVILIILATAVGGALALFAWRAGTLSQGGVFAPISREGALVLNNLFLTAGCGVVFVGTLYPLALEALTGDKISVGAPFFDATFAPLMVPLLLAVPFGPMLAWKRGDLYAASQRLFAAAGLSILAVVIVLALSEGGAVLAALAVGLGVWLMLGALSEIVFRIKLFQATLSESWHRAIGLPGSAWGTMLAHFGVGVLVVGITAVTVWPVERIVALRPGETIDLDSYQLTFAGVAPLRGPNWRAETGHFVIRRGGVEVGTLDPQRRVYEGSGMPTTEAAIRTFGFSQVYVSLGESGTDGTVAVRAFYKPWVTLVWIGALISALGGVVSLCDRRLRVGAPRRARGRLAPAPAE
jgi:cytochrome c-type biogenesis protein CcmF